MKEYKYIIDGKEYKVAINDIVENIATVSVGDEVNAGDTVVVLEAMKMANNLDAEKSGKVTAILVKTGENVLEDTALVVIE